MCVSEREREGYWTLGWFLYAVQVADGAEGGCISSDGAGEHTGVVFVSLLQNLLTREPATSDGGSGRLASDDIIFTTD